MDFSGMIYNPTVGGRMIDHYEDLSIYPVFTSPVEVSMDVLDQMIRYAILWNEPDSPLYRIKDLKKKHKECLSIANCSLEAEKYISSWGRDYRNVVFQILKLSNDYLMQQWWSRKLDYHSNVSYLAASLGSSSDPEKEIALKLKIKGALDQDMKELMELESTLFPDKRSRRAMSKAAEEASLDGYAEKHATNFFEEEIKSPYN